MDRQAGESDQVGNCLNFDGLFIETNCEVIKRVVGAVGEGGRCEACGDGVGGSVGIQGLYVLG